MGLEYCGALVTAAAPVEQARRILDTLGPHVLVTDIGMPEDGVALIREVTGMLETKGLRVPVIAVTAYTGRREELLAEGFEDILPKLIDRRPCAAWSGHTRRSNARFAAPMVLPVGR